MCVCVCISFMRLPHVWLCCCMTRCVGCGEEGSGGGPGLGEGLPILTKTEARIEEMGGTIMLDDV